MPSSKKVFTLLYKLISLCEKYILKLGFFNNSKVTWVLSFILLYILAVFVFIRLYDILVLFIGLFICIAIFASSLLKYFKYSSLSRPINAPIIPLTVVLGGIENVRGDDVV